MDELSRLFLGTGVALQFSNFTKNKYLETGRKMSKQLNMTFEPNKEELEFLESYNFDLVKNASQRELAKIKQVIELGVINNNTATEVKKAIDQIETRAVRNTNTLVRTEMNRANNMGTFRAMKNTGEDIKKYIVIKDDSRTSPQSHLFNNKYGSEEKAIPLDKEFKIIYKGKTYSGLTAPFMPNDRDIIAYTL